MVEQKKCIEIDLILDQLQIPREKFAAWSSLQQAAISPVEEAYKEEQPSLFPMFQWELGKMEYSK
ncbi:hypothetical protein ACFQ88_21615 [Paenibacillus sp. NPDC056579]|uniref:hypothetical protein n=1 Tax=unclassified Paenibacillus TaxID=185978 RepID=UPI001EF89E4E|nr:hypothetical protein [Paenibacillus sp. H1-7]ULL13997.1 hypothetical protein DVH26_05765 [Paenibacillus sp. H1-7]